MVQGVTEGYRRALEIVGVGYRAEKKGDALVLSVGYSHQVKYPEPDGIRISTRSPTVIVIEGIDKQKVGQVAAEIRSVRPPEPYKGKGIRYQGEQVRRKAGKAGAK
jgi:large subunit ribosomal protein L6